jgi:hypothetical protein
VYKKFRSFSLLSFFGWTIELAGKGRQTKHQNPEFEFGHTQGEIRKKPAKKYVSIRGDGVRR